MAKTIGQLTQATTIASGDEFVIEQSGLTKRIAASVVRGGLVDADIDAAADIAGSKLADGGVTLAKLVASVQNALIPVGTVQTFARSTAPTGWLAANGDTIGSASSSATNASADYSALFAVLWDNWTNTDLPILDSAGVASTRGANAAADFAANKRLPLPDLRGIFVRGSGSQTIDGTSYSGTFSEKLRDQMQAITGSFRAYSNNSAQSGAITTGTLHSSNNFASGAFANDRTFNFSSADSTDARTGTETRPANIALLYGIKF
jgi:microcystin-dependent protein